MTWKAYQSRLRKAGYRAAETHTYVHQETGRRIYPHNARRREDGQLWVNWRWWAKQDTVPDP
jgi:hypothetical protein